MAGLVATEVGNAVVLSADRPVSRDEASVACRIAWRHDWAPHLFSFRTVRPSGIDFVAGQFVRLGVPGVDGRLVWRAYSIVSGPADDHLEFYSILVPDGPFTQPLARLVVGDSIRIDPMVYGFLRTDRFVGGRDLWLLATGTGIAPFVSMLADRTLWTRFDDIVLVHSVRGPDELAYRRTIAEWIARPPAAGARLHYLPTLTGAPDVSGNADDADDPVTMRGRITTLLADGRLEDAIAIPISRETSRLMLCGNPSMIKETRALLGQRDMTPVRRETPGQYIAENFW